MRLHCSKHKIAGLVVIGLCAGFDFDGMANYSLAAVSAHTAVMNLKVWFEVVTSAVLLVVVIACLWVALLERPRSGFEPSVSSGQQDFT